VRYLLIENCNSCPKREDSYGICGAAIFCLKTKKQILNEDFIDSSEFPNWCPLETDPIKRTIEVITEQNERRFLKENSK